MPPTASAMPKPLAVDAHLGAADASHALSIGSQLDAVVAGSVVGARSDGSERRASPIHSAEGQIAGQSSMGRQLTADDLESPPRRRVVLPIVLFLATCLSTLFVWALSRGLKIDFLRFLELSVVYGRQGVLRDYWRWVYERADWQGAVIYMSAVVGILLTHEMGHFLQTVRYRIPSSLPFCIPFPLSPIGTMGAVIAMDGRKADRRQMFDIGITGPLAGLVVAAPFVWFGIQSAQVANQMPAVLRVGEYYPDPLIFRLLMRYLRPELPINAELELNPFLMAGWVGLFITGLNMLPVSQLDGGHVIYTLFGRRADWFVKLFMMVVIFFIAWKRQYAWILMTLIVMKLGILHPPTRDDSAPIGPMRWVLGLLSLLIPIFCFNPMMMIHP